MPLARASRSVALALAWLLGAACAHAPPPAETPATQATPVPEPLRSALSGTWVYAGGEPERAQVDQAVEHATADMGFLTRGIAAEALRARARPREQFTLAIDGSAVSISSPDYPTEQGEVGGAPVSITDRFGDTNQTTFQLRDGALVEAGKSADGSGETVFTPDPDGRTLRVRRLMQSDRISAPVDVTLSYRRQGGS